MDLSRGQISRPQTGDFVLAPPTRISAEKCTPKKSIRRVVSNILILKLNDGCDEQCSRNRVGFGCVSVHHSGCTGSGVSALPLSEVIWEWLQNAKGRGIIYIYNRLYQILLSINIIQCLPPHIPSSIPYLGHAVEFGKNPIKFLIDARRKVSGIQYLIYYTDRFASLHGSEIHV